MFESCENSGSQFLRGDSSAHRHENLRAKAIAVDAGARGWVDLGSIWGDLIAARVAAADTFCNDRRCYLILRPSSHAGARPPGLTQRNLEILRRAVLGQMQKAIAIDLSVGQSAIAFGAAQCLRAMGFECSASRVPSFVVMAAHAYYRSSWRARARSSKVWHRGERLSVVSVERPDPAMITSLSDAERAVVRLVVERRSNAEIAEIRATSVRTVANQLSSVLHKLRVNGRAGIICRLIEPSNDVVSSRHDLVAGLSEQLA